MGAAPYLAIWDHEPVFRQTITRFPDLMNHLGMVNFSSGKQPTVWPSDRQREPPVIKRSLKSTNRYSYQHPHRYAGPATASQKFKQPSCAPSNVPVVGIVPRLLVSKRPPETAPRKKMLSER